MKNIKIYKKGDVEVMQQEYIFVSSEELKLKDNKVLYKYNLLNHEDNQVFSIYKDIKIDKKFGETVKILFNIKVQQGKLTLKIEHIE